MPFIQSRSAHATTFLIFSLAAAALVLLTSMYYGTQHRASADAQLVHAIASESQAFCLKFGVAAGTSRNAECLADLMAIRKRHEQRVVRDQGGIL